MDKKIVLYSLQTFSSTGGIQKMTRTLAHSLYIVAQNNNRLFEFWSAYDSESELMTKYLPTKNFRGFGVQRLNFVIEAMKNAKQQDIIILSHVNLAIIGLLIKFINPKCKVWLIAHGIEIWRPLPFLKRSLLKHCNKIISVSNFTQKKLIDCHKIKPEILTVLNNAVDPFLKLPASFAKPAYLLQRYNLSVDNPVIFTLTRLSSYEQYKGHDQVIKTISRLKKNYPTIKYVLSGKPDLEETTRLEKLICKYDVAEQVILTGFVKEEELVDHFLLANLFVLPSKKEGFGIVFIEALACGVPVICGNADGSIDAICNGDLGTAINVDDLDELEKAISFELSNQLPEIERQNIQKQCLAHFDEVQYIKKWENLILNG